MGAAEQRTIIISIIIIYFKSGSMAHKNKRTDRNTQNMQYTIKTVKTHSHLKLKVTQMHNSVICTRITHMHE